MKKLSFLLFCLALFLGHYQAAAVDYYVKKTGNNGNSGTSHATAFLSIQTALNVASPGSTIYVDAGIYKERLWWPSSGTPGSRIRLTNYNGAAVTLDGGNGGTNTTQNAMIAVGDRSHIEISNLRIRNNYRSDAIGIHITGAGTDIRIIDCTIFLIGWTTNAAAIPGPGNNANPLVVVGSSSNSINDLLISGNKIYSCITGYSEALAVNGNVENFVVENNSVYNNTNIGIVIAGHYAWTGAPANVNYARNGTVRNNLTYGCVSQVAISAGIYIDGASDIVVEKNKSYDNGVGFSVGCENANATVTGILLRNNWSYKNREVGLQFGAIGAGSVVSNCLVSNNSFYANYTIGCFGAEIAMSDNDNNEIVQNILVPRTDSCVAIGIWGYTATNLALDYNLFWRDNGNSANMYANVNPDPHAVIGKPKFIKTNTTLASTDLHVKKGSKAINTGDPAFAAAPGETDIDGQVRVQSGRVDIGADETLPIVLFALEEPATKLQENAIMQIYPNPASEIVYFKVADAVSIAVFDMKGNLIWSKEPESGTEVTSFYCGQLNSGIYTVTIQKSDGSQVVDQLSIVK